jgi:hypothetical protein
MVDGGEFCVIGGEALLIFIYPFWTKLRGKLGSTSR